MMELNPALPCGFALDLLLAGDIDRDGVFAQLCGMVALHQQVPRGPGNPAPRPVHAGGADRKAGTGVIPCLNVDVDDEDSLAPRLTREKSHKLLDAAVVRLPRISNFTDFTPLEEHPQIGVRYVDDPRTISPKCTITAPL